MLCQTKDSQSMVHKLTSRMEEENRSLKHKLSQPLSVYFDAYRTEDYLDGGEEYLTFAGIFHFHATCPNSNYQAYRT